jgi:glycosyltransferase involved in cell wall biosynthesis
MKLLLYNLSVNKKNPALSFTNDWIVELSKKFNQIYVLTLDIGEYELPKNVNVYSINTFSHNKAIQTLNFYIILFRLLLSKKPDYCFSHMNTLFVSMTGFFLKILGIKISLWYAHPSINLKLKIASFFSDTIITSLKSSYPLNHSNCMVIGQAIDSNLFNIKPVKKSQDLPIIFVGRVSRSKRIDLLIENFKQLGSIPNQLHIYGPEITNDDQRYKLELLEIIEKLNLKGKVLFKGSVDRKSLPKIYSNSIMHINLTQRGFGDKVALESMSCGTPTLYANSDFNEFIPTEISKQLYFENDLLGKIKALLTLDESKRNEIGIKLHGIIEKNHSLSTLGDRLFNAITSK